MNESKIKSLREKAIDLVNKTADDKPNVACFVVYVEKSNTNLLLNDPQPISRAKFAKLVHEGKLLSSCEVDGVVAYRVLI